MNRIALYFGSLACHLWLGAAFFVTFAAAPVLFRFFPPKQAADTLSVLFVFYGYFLLICALLVCLALFFYKIRTKAKLKSWWFTAFASLLSLACMLLQYLYIFPESKRVRIAMNAARDSAAMEEFNLMAPLFSKLHSWSMIVNLVVIVAGIYLAFVFLRHLEKSAS